MIYLYDKMDNIPDEIIRQTYSLMPLERKRRASRFRFERDKNLCVLAYWLLMYGLRKEYGIITAPALSYEAGGKPFLSDYDRIYFNISHCGAGVACAISNDKVGIDIQETVPYDDGIAKQVCTKIELAMLANGTSPKRLFCELWTIKESCVKLSGDGLTQPLNEIDAYKTFEKAGIKKTACWNNSFHICCFGEDIIVNALEDQSDI